MKLRYPNGEFIKKEDIGDESWYSDFNNLAEWYSMGDNVETLYRKFLKDYKEMMKKDYPNKERVLRWSVHIVSRMEVYNDCLKIDNACATIKSWKDSIEKEQKDIPKDFTDVLNNEFWNLV